MMQEILGNCDTDNVIAVGARPDDPVGGELGEFPSDVGEDINEEQGEVPLELVELGLADDLACSGGDNAEIGVGGDGLVDRGVDLDVGKEGGGVLEVELLAAEHVGLVVDDDELVGEVLSEDGLSNGHSDISSADDEDRVAVVGGRGKVGVGDGLEEGLG
ncbi:hypothetical protein SESBI_35619 [Sesbania bispinosa]|nr:hypothetical protein SESBI_35619 [Sesbania bispinosa]